MILVDTSVWIDHLRKGEPSLIELLENNQVLMHPFISGELACGNLRNRTVILRMLRDLPPAMVADDNEVQLFIERHQLMGSGIGYVDAHLLAATALNRPAKIWTRDRTLQLTAVKLDLSFIK